MLAFCSLMPPFCSAVPLLYEATGGVAQWLQETHIDALDQRCSFSATHFCKMILKLKDYW